MDENRVLGERFVVSAILLPKKIARLGTMKLVYHGVR